jgi:hypothetical protein
MAASDISATLQPDVPPRTFAVSRRLSPLPLARLPVLVTLIALGVRGVTDSDIWGHMLFGLNFLETRALPLADRYSFTSNQQWINHEWFSDVLFGFAYSHGGLVLLTVLRSISLASALFVVNRGLRSVSWPVRDLLMAVIVVSSLPLLGAVRPQIFSIPLYALTLVALSNDAVWLPAVFLAWANLHGGWLLGFGAVVVRTVCAPTKQRLFVLAGCALATLVTPYGVALWTSLAEAIMRGWNGVVEWEPVWRLSSGEQPMIIWLLLASALCWAAYRKPSAEPWKWIWTTCVAIASLRARRHVPFFAATEVLLILSSIRVRGIDLSKLAWSPQAAFVLAAPLAVACYLAAPILAPTVSCLPAIDPPMRPEASAVRFIRTENLRGNVLTWFDWGLYAIWHVGDQMRVSIDNRRETVYSAQTVADHWQFYSGGAPDYPDRIGADYVWLPLKLAPVEQLQARHWHVVYRGPRSTILSRVDRPLTVGQSNAGGQCFPEP